MDLILWRHAEAEDGIDPDGERKLTAKGIEQAARMAKWLRRRLPEGAVVVASPAKRAQQTARELTADLKVVEQIDPSASAEDVLRACDWPKTGRSLVVVGHQPALGEVAAMLLTGIRGQLNLSPGAVIWIAYSAGDGFARAQLRAAIAPDLL